jgi:oligopeptide/dipeptide ABC transporter ATP-binding protein
MLLQVKNLCTYFYSEKGIVKAVDGVSLNIEEGGIYGLVGESGCGKSMTLLSLLRLIPRTGKIVNGEIIYRGYDLLKKKKKEMTSFRGKEMSMIFQDAQATLNPVYRVGEQVRESLRVHRVIINDKKYLSNNGNDVNFTKKEREKVKELMEEVGISAPEERYFDYPHQFSGGMQQRIIIAIALSCSPSILLADEPTTALDVTIQAQILELISQINRDRNMAILLVTHDLAVTAEFCDHISVMYAGKIVEQGNTDDIIENPCHPYTRGLLNAIPKITKAKEPLKPIAGNVPSLLNLPEGCAFYDRCGHAKKSCLESQRMREVETDHLVRCCLYDDAKEIFF